jgi:RNA polymerase sigma-70 factor (ECF subfamily)
MLLQYWSGLAEQSSPSSPDLSAEYVFRRYVPRLYSLARRLTGNEADAEDVVGDVLVAVLRKLDTFRGESELSTWLHRVTVNAVLLLRRKWARRPEGQTAVPLAALRKEAALRAVAASPEGPEQQALDEEMRQQVEGALACLPRAYRDVLVLADVERRPNAEIAGLMGLSWSAVKNRLDRARLLLRRALAPYFSPTKGAAAAESPCSARYSCRTRRR